jgi:hypothetical protein
MDGWQGVCEWVAVLLSVADATECERHRKFMEK